MYCDITVLILNQLYTFLILIWFFVTVTYAVIRHVRIVLYFYIILWQILYPVDLLNLIWIWWMYNKWMTALPWKVA